VAAPATSDVIVETITPRLRADVLLRPFQAFDGDDRFIVAVDNRHFVVSPAVAAVLEASRTQSTLGALAERASTRLGFTVSPDLASRVLSEQLLSVLFHASEQRADAACPVRMRQCLVGARTLRPLLAVASKLFTVPAAVVLMVSLGVIEALVAQRAFGSAPELLLGSQVICAAGLTLLGAFVHELGHLAACTRFQATHGGIGVGIYWCMPVLYAEVNGAWMLPRMQRAVVDAGGLYLQCLYVAALGVAYLATGTPFVLEAIVWSHVLMLHTLNPVLKYDGYWLLTDASGTGNLHGRISKTAQQVLHAIGRTPGVTWPGALPLALLTAFSGIALVYVAYVLTILGGAIGRCASQALYFWTTHAETRAGAWHAIGESALLGLLLVAAALLALLLAHSLTHLGKESHAC
jgi:putative peptide zinc metalloprotease protein